MIYSRLSKSYIPITVEKTFYNNPNYHNITKYVVKDGRIPVGRVSISDLPNGAFVEFVENFHPDLYKGMTDTAYQIQVEHCMQKGLSEFEIISNASLNSHAIHYLHGKRFIPSKFNKIVEKIIKNTPQGERYNTRHLGGIKMYMPQELIKKYMEIIKKSPLLKIK